MSPDARLRSLERSAASGDLESQARLVAEQCRVAHAGPSHHREDGARLSRSEWKKARAQLPTGPEDLYAWTCSRCGEDVERWGRPAWLTPEFLADRNAFLDASQKACEAHESDCEPCRAWGRSIHATRAPACYPVPGWAPEERLRWIASNVERSRVSRAWARSPEGRARIVQVESHRDACDACEAHYHRGDANPRPACWITAEPPAGWQPPPAVRA